MNTLDESHCIRKAEYTLPFVFKVFATFAVAAHWHTSSGETFRFDVGLRYILPPSRLIRPMNAERSNVSKSVFTDVVTNADCVNCQTPYLLLKSFFELCGVRINLCNLWISSCPCWNSRHEAGNLRCLGVNNASIENVRCHDGNYRDRTSTSQTIMIIMRQRTYMHIACLSQTNTTKNLTGHYLSG